MSLSSNNMFEKREPFSLMIPLCLGQKVFSWLCLLLPSLQSVISSTLTCFKVAFKTRVSSVAICFPQEGSEITDCDEVLVVICKQSVFVLVGIFGYIWNQNLKNVEEKKKREEKRLCDLGNVSVFAGLLHHSCLLVLYIDDWVVHEFEITPFRGANDHNNNKSLKNCSMETETIQASNHLLFPSSLTGEKVIYYWNSSHGTFLPVTFSFSHHFHIWATREERWTMPR